MSELVLETRAMTPPVDEGYWAYRVRLTDRQAIIGFPKFGTIGIGFAVEKDWNTNLPYTCPAEEIYDHIAHNKIDESISREDCITAIRLIQDAVTAERGGRAASALITPTARLLAPAGLPREEWLAMRRMGIGGSDVAAILGMDPHRGPLHVYLDKRGELEEQRSRRLDRQARRGHRLEGLIGEFFAEETGHAVVKAPGTFQHAERPWMLANCDALVIEAPQGGTAAAIYQPDALLPDDVAGPLEFKSRTWRSARGEGWDGEEPPDGPALQAHWYMAVTGYSRAWVAGLIDDDLIWWRLERDEELIGHLVQITSRFWYGHVLAGVEPDPGDLESTGELLAHMRDIRPGAVRLVADSGELARLDGLLAERARLKAQIAEAQRELVAVENRLKQALGDAEVAIAPGRELYSWRRDGQFSVKRFREQMPELAAEYTHLVEAVDRERLAAEKPDVYRRYRARVLRPGRPS